jgi:hypothetical protein
MMTTEQATEIFEDLAREEGCDKVDDVSVSDGCWSARVRWCREWYTATFEDRYPEGAQVHWSAS